MTGPTISTLEFVPGSVLTHFFSAVYSNQRQGERFSDVLAREKARILETSPELEWDLNRLTALLNHHSITGLEKTQINTAPRTHVIRVKIPEHVMDLRATFSYRVKYPEAPDFVTADNSLASLTRPPSASEPPRIQSIFWTSPSSTSFACYNGQTFGYETEALDFELVKQPLALQNN